MTEKNPHKQTLQNPYARNEVVSLTNYIQVYCLFWILARVK